MGRKNMFIALKNKSRKRQKFYENKKIFVKHENLGKEKLKFLAKWQLKFEDAASRKTLRVRCQCEDGVHREAGARCRGGEGVLGARGGWC